MGWILFLVWIGGAALVAYVAEQRGRSGAALAGVSLVFSPLIGLLVCVALPVVDKATQPKKPPRDRTETALYVSAAVVGIAVLAIVAYAATVSIGSS